MPITIIAACDDSFSQHLGVMITSLFYTKAPATMISRIYVLDGGIASTNKEKLSCICKRYACSIEFIRVDPSIYAGYMLDNGVPHQSTYYRISIPDLVDSKLEKILYLDCDIIIRKDLQKLWDTDIRDYYLAAVPDWIAEKEQKVYLAKAGQYFNSGVMLMNLKNWRADGISKKIIIFLKEHNERLVFREQDGVNAITYKNYLQLSPTYNQLNFFARLPVNETTFTANELREAITDPAIVHFTGEKPWKWFTEHPFKHLYYRYLWKTPWKWYWPLDLTYTKIKYEYLYKHPKQYAFLMRTKRFLKNLVGLNVTGTS